MLCSCFREEDANMSMRASGFSYKFLRFPRYTQICSSLYEKPLVSRTSCYVFRVTRKNDRVCTRNHWFLVHVVPFCAFLTCFALGLFTLFHLYEKPLASRTDRSWQKVQAKVAVQSLTDFLVLRVPVQVYGQSLVRETAGFSYKGFGRSIL